MRGRAGKDATYIINGRRKRTKRGLRITVDQALFTSDGGEGRPGGSGREMSSLWFVISGSKSYSPLAGIHITF